jgi:hypothetical protein
VYFRSWRLRDGETRFQNWYRVMLDGVSGWQAQKPTEYVAVPYVGSLAPFDAELTNEALIWPEGEKDHPRSTHITWPDAATCTVSTTPFFFFGQ